MTFLMPLSNAGNLPSAINCKNGVRVISYNRCSPVRETLRDSVYLQSDTSATTTRFATPASSKHITRQPASATVAMVGANCQGNDPRASRGRPWVDTDTDPLLPADGRQYVTVTNCSAAQGHSDLVGDRASLCPTA